MRLAIVADWLPIYGGAEHVIASFHRLWPQSPIHTTIVARAGIGPLASADVRTRPFLQFLFRSTGKYQWLLPFFAHAIEQIDLSGRDIVLSSSHAIGKGIIPPSSAVHICYCHTPMRYAWEMEREYLDDFHLIGPLRRSVRALLSRLRRWDLTTAKRVDLFIANSQETQQRIQRIYGRTSIVLPPPVEDVFFQSDIVPAHTRSYFLAVGRLVPYKRFDLLIALANTYQLPLKIVGSGQQEAYLRSLAGPTVEFLGHVPSEDLPSLYAGAKALLFPQIEDAGVVPREAQAVGTPVIAFGRGGILDTIVPQKTGLFVAEQTIEAFAEAISICSGQDWDYDSIREHARAFSRTHFETALREIVSAAYTKYHSEVSTTRQRADASSLMRS